MKKIPSFYAWFTSILMVLSAVSFAEAAYNNVTLSGDEDAGFYINMGTEGDDFLIIPDNVSTFNVYDDGGVDGQFSSGGVDNTLVLVAPSGKQLQIKGRIISSDDIAAGLATFRVFDGNSVDGELLLSKTDAYTSDFMIGNSGRFVTIAFDAPEYNPNDGFALEVNVVDPTVSYEVSSLDVSNGDFSVDAENASFGDVVTVTTEPDANFFVDHITVTDASGTKLPVEKIADNTFTFKMIAATDISVKPFFNTKVVSYGDNGCLKDGAYFHIECYDDNGSGYCSLSQGLVESPATTGSIESGKDFECWSDLVDDLDGVYGYWEIALRSDLDLGGYDEAESKCVMDFKPFAELDGFGGNGYTIRNFCFVSDTYAGFAPASANFMNRTISNVTFENAYVEASAGAAGVVGIASRVTNVIIDGATVKGDNAGAVMGEAPGGTSYYNSVEISGVSVTGATTIEGNGNVGGLVGITTEKMYLTIEKSSVNCDVSGTGYVGGLVGFVDSDIYRITIQNTYTIGDITAGQTDDPGYLVGAIDGTPTDLTIKNNYHYGDDKVKFGVGNQAYTTATWRNATGFTCNIRNSVDGLDADGSLYFSENDDECIQLPAQGFNANGVVPDNQMKSAKFAAVLNGKAMASVWSEADGENRGLPFFANETYKPIRPVGFSYNEYDAKNTDQDKRDVFDAALGGKIMFEYYGTNPNPPNGDKGFNLYTDYTGHLSETDIEFLTTISEDGAYWYSSRGRANTSTSLLEYSAGGYFKYDKDEEIEIVYVLCMNTTCTSEEELTPDLELENYTLGFTYYPIRRIQKSDFDTPIPALSFIENDGTLTYGTHCAYRYKVNSTDPSADAFEGSLEDEIELFGDIFNEVDFDYYEKKVYLYYRTDAYAIDFEPQDGNRSGFKFQSYIYSLDGASSIAYQKNIDGYSNAYFAASFKITPPAGYAIESFSVSFRSGTNTVQSPNYIDVEDEYIVSSDAFMARNGDVDVWRKTFAGNAEVHLDSIYKSLARTGIRPTGMSLTITPKLVPVEYTVNFNLNAPSDDASSALFLGHNWNAVKTVSLKDGTLPHLYSIDCPAAVGWKTSSANTSGYKEFVDLFNASSNDLNEESATDLYAHWKEDADCESGVDTYNNLIYIEYYVGNAQSSTDDPEKIHGTFKLQQNIDDENVISHDMEATKEVTVAVEGEPDQNYYAYRTPIPQVDDTLTFKAVVKPDEGYKVGEIIYTPDPSTTEHVPTTENLTLGYSEGVLRINPDMLRRAEITAEILPITYSASFDISSLEGKIVVLGQSWAEEKDDLDVETNKTLPKVYVYSESDDAFNTVAWSGTLKTYPSDEWTNQTDWKEWVENYATIDLTPSILSSSVKDESEPTKLAFYPIDAAGTSLSGQNINVFEELNIYLGKATGIGNPPAFIPAESDNAFHGVVVLSQKSGDLTFSQASQPVSYIDDYGDGDDTYYRHTLLLPDLLYKNEKLEFDVHAEADPGYEMTITGFEVTEWNDAEPNGEWGYDGEKLIIYPDYMLKMQMYVDFTMQNYNVAFTVPDEELFVANKIENKKYLVDWFDWKADASVEDSKMPPVYNAKGCRVGWKLEGSTEAPVTDLVNIFKKMTSTESDESAINRFAVDPENEICNQKEISYKQVLTVEEGMGTIRLVQVLGTAPIIEGEPEQKIVLSHSFTEDETTGEMTLQVPQAFNKVEGQDTETGVTFMVVAEPENGYTLDHITYITSKNGNMMDVTQGDSTTLNVMEDLEWHVYFKKLDPVYVTYDLQLDLLDDINGLFLPKGAAKSEVLEIETDKDSAKFWIPYHMSQCFAGWSMKQENAGVELYKSLNADNYVEFSNNEDNPTKLFAIWKDCEVLLPTNIAVSNSSSDVGLVLYQVYEGDTIRHSLASGFELNGTSFDFYIDKVNSEVEEGYSLGKVTLSYTTANDEDPVDVEEVSTGLWRIEAMDENGVTNYTFNAKARKNLDKTIRLAYDENTDEDVFFGPYWRIEDEITEDVDWTAPDIANLPVAGRTDACFVGWSADKNATEGYTILEDLVDALGINDAVANSLDEESTSEEPLEFELYAVWDEGCTPRTFTVHSQVPAYEGTFGLVQKIRGREFVYSVPEEDLVVPVFEGMTYLIEYQSKLSEEVDSILVSWDDYMMGTESIKMSNGAGYTVSYGQPDLVLDILDEDTTHQFILSVDVDSDTVFYGSGFSSFKIIAEEDGDIPMSVYRKGYKLVGWTFDDSEPPVSPAYQYDPAATAQGNVTHPSNYVYTPSVHKAFDEKFAEDFAMYELTYGETPDTLFAVWEKDSAAKTVTLVNLTPNVGNILLVQYFDGYMFEYELRDTLTIPYGEDIGFMVDLEADYEQWGIDERRAIKVYDEIGERIGVLESYSYLIVSQSMGLAANISQMANGTKIKVAFDLNSKDSVFFGSDWQQEAVYEVGGEFQQLPALVYTSDKCIAGWSRNKKSEKTYTYFNQDLIEDLETIDNVTLYARWTADLDSCAGFYMVLAIEQENGTVQLVEGDDLHARTHEFTSKGTMLLPYEVYGGDFRVQSKPDSSYVLDSLVVSIELLNRSRTLYEGDALPDVLEVTTLKAYFGKANKTPIQIVDTSFVQSGNAIQLSFKASDFEVTRGVSARVQVIDSKDSVVIDSLLGDSVAMGYGRDVVLRVKRAGEYRAVLTLEDSLEMDEYTKEFFVKNEIESIAADSWQMLSLAAVDTSVLDKRDSDQIFYWWDEEGTGEFWQYKQFVKGDEIVPTRGVWYSSLEARPLKLRDDIDDDGKDFVWELDSVSSGWNLIANTHGWTVDLYAKNPGKKKAVDEKADVTFYHYDAQTGGYYEDRYLKPYEAIWAKVTKKTSWKVSAEPVFKPEEEPLMDSVEFEDEVLQKRVLAKASTKERWTLQAVLYDGNGKKDSWNIFGAGLNPFTAAEPPESMGDHVNLSIVEGRHALAKSIRNASDDMEWNVALSASSDRMGYLSLAGIAGVNALGYHVYVTVDGNTTEMKEGESLKVYLKENAKTATIRVAPAEKVVAENSLKGLRMARLGGKLQVTFDATGLAGKSARVDLMDMKGHVISTVSAKTVDGSNALLLDAPQTGLYMLRVRAGSQQQATKVVVK